MGKTKLKTPQQEVRARLLAKHGLKGAAKANIWFTRCLRTGEELVFVGDPRIEHFYACEGDPRVVMATYEISPISVQVDGKRFDVRFDARVELRGGEIELRKVGATVPQEGVSSQLDRFKACVEGASRLGGTYHPVTLAELDGLTQRISNWRRALRWLRACRHHALAEVELLVQTRLRLRRRLAITELIEAVPEYEAPLVLGAIVSLLHKRVLLADLDRVVWSGLVVVTFAEATG